MYHDTTIPTVLDGFTQEINVFTYCYKCHHLMSYLTISTCTFDRSPSR